MGSIIVGCERDDRDGRRLHFNALDVVDEIAAVRSLDELSMILARAFSRFAIEHFVMTGLPQHERIERVVMLRNWPQGWFETYIGENFVRHDPVVKKCRQTVLPFEWSEAPFDVEREPGALKVMTRARDFGLEKGFCIPIHGFFGYEACFSMSGTAPDLDRRTKAALHLIAMYAFERARALTLRLRPDTVNPLTAREKEVLTWAAFGKSHSEIAEILTVTERTITAHTVNATNKLGAANKTQAVVRAMQSNFIRL